ncbi:hypothetical protein Ga0100231_010645 [Opitutaceae bacterium TAV4]|nr:hypothetical protein Ga0100231_010645 [Opitutaceae bacterium TAV4]RRJ98801.1 hypothetical protein Ga0100230_010755 [Opitutaceae bacterium TAV3]
MQIHTQKTVLTSPSSATGVSTLLTVFASVFLTLCAQASLLIYEGFDGYTAGADIKSNSAVSSTTVGLTGKYNSSSVQVTVKDAGLTFSNLLVSGGSLTHSSTTGTTIGVKLSGTTAYSGTLYSSYLVNFTSNVGNTPSSIVCIASSSDASTTSRSLASAADNGGSYSTIGVGYSGVGANATNGSLTLSSGTYMILARYTHVGETLSESTPGVATLWVLSADQFDHFKSTNFADIDSATTGLTATSVTGKVIETKTSGKSDLFTGNGTYLQAILNGNSAARAIDEIRFGTSFADVTPITGNIPEPATTTLIVTSLTLLAAIASRRFIRMR